MHYRSDIDGLRAIAVLSVIAFHAGIETFSGGFVGVDVFFVISGYLITTLIYEEISQQRFSFISFYKRRAARLLPALALTLLMVSVLGFFFYDAQTYDAVGKEIFFSALGLVNLYFAQGTDYFASADNQQPLIHLWSLGVEEQFYLVWPLLLLLLLKINARIVLPVVSVLLLSSLIASEWAAQLQSKGAYFLPHYRAFELMLGAVAAYSMRKGGLNALSDSLRQLITIVGFLLVLVPMVALDEQSSFPGLNALWPCLGTVLLILTPNKGLLTKTLSMPAMVGIGLVSYPLYLYHQPFIAYLDLLNVPLQGALLFVVTLVVAGAASWLTYRWVEQPVRRLAHKSATPTQRRAIAGLVCTIPVFALIGIVLGRTDGLPSRFEYLNPFAAEVSRAHDQTFERHFANGYQVDEESAGGMLVLGDSLAQQYTLPLMNVLNYSPEQVDTVTRGACVFLKGVDFRDQIADISCDELRTKLYAQDKSYDYVVITQAWHFYKESVRNFVPETDQYQQWSQLLKETIRHFSARAEHIVIIGAHPMLTGTEPLQASIFITPERYRQRLSGLSVENKAELRQGVEFFSLLAAQPKVIVIHPSQLFCDDRCQLHNGTWSYFSDHMHITSKALPFVEQQLRLTLPNH